MCSEMMAFMMRSGGIPTHLSFHIPVFGFNDYFGGEGWISEHESSNLLLVSQKKKKKEAFVIGRGVGA